MFEANQNDVRELLGHANLKMTSHYTHHTHFSNNTVNHMNNIFHK